MSENINTDVVTQASLSHLETMAKDKKTYSDQRVVNAYRMAKRLSLVEGEDAFGAIKKHRPELAESLDEE